MVLLGLASPVCAKGSLARENAARAAVKPSPFYPGITADQSALAHQVIRCVHSLDWDTANKLSKRLQALERKDGLPPLSYLIMVSAWVMRLQNNEYPDAKTEAAIHKEIQVWSREGLRLSDPRSAPDSSRPTHLLIHGGITGFRATLKIHEEPFEALNAAFDAVRWLEEALRLDSSIKDAYLGTGIFHCAIANAPRFIRSALKMLGRTASLQQGLEHLRNSAYGGQYTTVVAQQYLIQFLSPYQGDLMREKWNIFETMQERFPLNPFYVFLEFHEALCFHPKRFYSLDSRKRLEEKLESLKPINYSSHRYIELIKWQYWLMNPFPASALAPDSTFILREFAFYPAFIKAAREKHLLQSPVDKTTGTRDQRLALMRKLEAESQQALQSDGMSRSRRGFYAWHVRDALKPPD